MRCCAKIIVKIGRRRCLVTTINPFKINGALLNGFNYWTKLDFKFLQMSMIGDGLYARPELTSALPKAP